MCIRDSPVAAPGLRRAVGQRAAQPVVIARQVGQAPEIAVGLRELAGLGQAGLDLAPGRPAAHRGSGDQGLVPARQGLGDPVQAARCLLYTSRCV